MRSDKPSSDFNSSLRIWLFTTDQNCSIGLSSGEYGERLVNRCIIHDEVIILELDMIVHYIHDVFQKAYIMMCASTRSFDCCWCAAYQFALFALIFLFDRRFADAHLHNTSSTNCTQDCMCFRSSRFCFHNCLLSGRCISIRTTKIDTESWFVDKHTVHDEVHVSRQPLFCPLKALLNYFRRIACFWVQWDFLECELTIIGHEIVYCCSLDW